MSSHHTSYEHTWIAFLAFSTAKVRGSKTSASTATHMPSHVNTERDICFTQSGLQTEQGGSKKGGAMEDQIAVPRAQADNNNLTKQDVQDLIAVVLPSLLQQMGQQHQPILPPQ